MKHDDLKPFHHALKILEDNCIGCVHCMRVCPTDAIRIFSGKAHVDQNRCVDCGECLNACPVDAIVVEQDDFNKIFSFDIRALLVPAILIGQFPEDIVESQILAALHELGFTHIFEVETIVPFLNDVFIDYQNRSNKKPLISSFCPAIVRLIQVRFPSLVGNIAQLKAPLDVAALYVRNLLEKKRGKKGKERSVGVFYVTPCAAKIAAVKSPVSDEEGRINGVINMDFIYNKMLRIISDKKIKPEQSPESVLRSGREILWSVTNGECYYEKGRSLAIDEIHNVINFLERVENGEMDEVDFLELRACDQSCAGGALAPQNRFLTVERLKNRVEKNSNRKNFNTRAFLTKNDISFLLENISVRPISPRSILKLDDDIEKAMVKMESVREMMKLSSKY